MASKIKTNKNGILLWRLGTLKFGEQSMWSRAPESKGMWCFPWPYYDSFFTYHQYSYLLPKTYQTRGKTSMPQDLKWYKYPDGSTPTNVTFDEEWGGLHDDEEAEVIDAFWEERDAWIENVGKKILPVRKFWYDGMLYSHIHPSGEIGNAGTFMGNAEWYKMDSGILAQAIKKSGGDSYTQRDKDGQLHRWTYSVDHLEIFVPPHAGKIISPRHK